jgi:peptidoglycan/xylan/chitin deacetylase (PgdA/CDA1 family)
MRVAENSSVQTAVMRDEWIAASTHSNTARSVIRLVFRYDDYSSQSSTELESQLVETLAQYQACATFAVVPAMVEGNYRDLSPKQEVELSAAKIHVLRDAIDRGVIEVALHGFSHQTIRPANQRGGCTEFENLDYADQLRKISHGRDILERQLGTRICTFVPPWNTYDLNTLRAVEASGCEAISAGIWGVHQTSARLSFAPATCPLNLKKIRHAVEAARRGNDPDAAIVVLFHPADFVEAGCGGTMTLAEFRSIVKWAWEQADISIATVSELCRRSGVDMGAGRMSRNLARSQSLWSRLLPSYDAQSSVYWGADARRRLRATRALGFHLLTLIGWALLGAVLWSWVSGPAGMTAALAGVMLFAFGIFAASKRAASNRLFRIATAMVFLMGFLSGFLVRLMP